MKPLFSSRALNDIVRQFLTTPVLAASPIKTYSSSTAPCFRPKVLLGFGIGSGIWNRHRPSLLPGCATGPGRVTCIHSTPVFDTEKAPRDTIHEDGKHEPVIQELSSEPPALQIFEEKDQEISRPRVDLRSKDRPTLGDIMKWELLLDESPDKIRNLWLDYHGKQWRRQGKIKKGDAHWSGPTNAIGAVVSLETFRAMKRKAKESPHFLYAIPRGKGGIEFVVGEWKETDIHFTMLIQYQLSYAHAREGASPDPPVAFVIHHFQELAESKDVVLLRGEFDPDAFAAIEAHVLLTQVQQYYGENATDARQRLLYQFNHQPKLFSHIHVVNQLDWI